MPVPLQAGVAAAGRAVKAQASEISALICILIWIGSWFIKGTSQKFRFSISTPAIPTAASGMDGAQSRVRANSANCP